MKTHHHSILFLSILFLRCALLLIISVVFVCMHANTMAQVNDALPFKLIRHQMIVIPVTINGVGPFEFLLDTGTNTTLIEPELAKELGLRPVDRIMLTTVAGEQAVPRAFLRRLAVGPARSEQVETLITEMPSLHKLRASIRGTLGQNFLSRFNYLLDYRERRIEFDIDGKLATRLQGARVPFESHEGLIVSKAQPMPSCETTWRLVLDSGSTNLILFSPLKLSRDFELALQESNLLEATTNMGHRTVQRDLIPKLQIGDAIFSDLSVAMVPPHTSEQAADGLLPMSLFRAIYVNHQKHYVIFNPRPRTP